MPRRFGGETWSVELPDGWGGSHDPECATILGTPEVGALQVSACFKDGDVTDDDLRDLLSDRPDLLATASSVRLGAFTGFVGTCETEEHYCRE